ncbi:hypothetical protein FQN54_004583 [Arachnomyces sp. PD_36]|nr:hypothetical protein FQN54_004583 [Arachnomyces sp. PD_36]
MSSTLALRGPRKRDQPVVTKATSERAKKGISKTTTSNVQSDNSKAYPKVPAGRKRKAAKAVEDAVEKPTRGQKRQKEDRAVSNLPPTQRLDIYVIGVNSYGELGLGDSTKKGEIRRPVLNPKLPAETVGVVHVAAGGAHSAALTYDNKILTWGINDEGTLGRDTKEAKKDTDMKEADAAEESESDEDDDEVDLNSKEATPIPIDPSHFPNGTIFTQIVATDSATFVLTKEGLVYGWGSFRKSTGTMGFSPDTKIQRTPVPITALKNVVKLAAGAQHVLALTANGTVFSWGCDEQNQLGRTRSLRRVHEPHLVPEQCALPTGITELGAGLYHSFAIHKSGDVYAWGSNNFGQTGILSGAGGSDADVTYPTKVKNLRKSDKIISISGGKDHSIAITDKGQCLTWGRVDNKALGLDMSKIASSDIIVDSRGRPRISCVPAPIPGIDGEVTFATAGTDHSFAITKDGKAYSWGFNVHGQAGQPGGEEIEIPTLLMNKHLNGKKLVSAAAGGQFSILAGDAASFESLAK